MRRAGATSIAIGALPPIIYCGGLLYFFLNQSGSVEDAEAIGLGPTLLGLATVGLFFCAVFVGALLWKFGRPRSPGAGGRGGPGGSDDGDGALDADAVIARYMAERAPQTDPESPAQRAAGGDGGPARAVSFGRKNR
jgi:hypothetical protein